MRWFGFAVLVPALIASLIVISKGNESTVVSSVSDDPTRYNYVETCKAIHDHEHLFESFRRIPGYIEIVEPTDLSIAEKTIRYMLKNHSWVIKNPGVFQKMAQIDRVGNPYLHKISVDAAEPFSISTVALRYGMYAGKVSSYLMDVAKAKNREIESVVEIGGGFGGFGIVATDFFEFTSYTIVDIPEAVKVQKKFVSEFPLLSPVFKFVDGKSIEDPPSGEQYDLCVSTNAFSELTLEFRELYFRHYISKCKYGFFIDNGECFGYGKFAEAHSQLGTHRFVDKLRQTREGSGVNIKIVEEDPNVNGRLECKNYEIYFWPK